MYPPIFSIVAASATATGLLGSNPVRFWSFGSAPGPTEAGYGVPYATHQLAYGTPSNTLACAPDEDHAGVQIDVYGKTATEARNAADAIRDAIEASHNLVVSYDGDGKDDPTGLYRVIITADFWVER
jgi:hypothetical protein